MITEDSIRSYPGIYLDKGSNFLNIAPCALLRPFISNYTISFPTPETMPDDYTVLPTASSTLIAAVNADRINIGLRGINTKACNVGTYANKMKLLLLIEFHPGGLYPFLRIDQPELVDSSFTLEELDKNLARTLEHILLESTAAEGLVQAVDRLFLNRLIDNPAGNSITAIKHSIIKSHGNIRARALADEFNYSEKQLERLFLRFVGTSPKTFMRIVRTNYAIRILQNRPASFTDIAVQAGFFDQPHFIHDFRAICGLAPQEYLKKMSIFYNDRFKM